MEEEILARRYGMTIKTSDMKNIIGGGSFSDRVMIFFLNFLNEKKGIIEKVYNSYIFDPDTTSYLFQSIGSKKFAFEKSHKMIEERLKIKNGFKTLKRAFFVAKSINSRYYLIEYFRGLRSIEATKGKSKLLQSFHKSKGSLNRLQYSIIIYDPSSESDPDLLNHTLEIWRDFILFVLKESGEKSEKDDFELSIGDSLKQPNLLDIGLTVCQYASLLFEENCSSNDPKLKLIEQKDLTHLRIRVKNLIEAVGLKEEISEYVFKKL